MEFEDFVRERGDALLRHATVVSADPHSARDLVQAVLERAFRRWDTIAGLDHPEAYVRRMLVNEFISGRRRAARLLLSGLFGHETAIGHDHAQQTADRTALVAELRRLPPRQRAALSLRYWDGLTDAQIAEQMGCSESTVRGYIWRALRSLRADFVQDMPRPAALEVRSQHR